MDYVGEKDKARTYLEEAHYLIMLISQTCHDMSSLVYPFIAFLILSLFFGLNH